MSKKAIKEMKAEREEIKELMEEYKKKEVSTTYVTTLCKAYGELHKRSNLTFKYRVLNP